MKRVNRPTCRFCGTTLAGPARECIRCFALNTLPCPKCVVQLPQGGQRVKRNGKGGEPVHCKFCGNKRFVWKGD